MLQMINGSLLATDDYSITYMRNGLNELHFSVSLSDPAYLEMREETKILETTTQQTYTVKTIDSGQKTAAIGCQLDLDGWKAVCLIAYSSGLKTAAAILRDICPAGWYLRGELTESKKRAIEMDGPTPLELALDVQERFNCAIQFDNCEKTATVLYPAKKQLSNAYVIDSVNLRKQPEFKGKSTSLYTRLYPIGKDGLQIGMVNDGKNYVENLHYTDAVICKVWRDDRYTDAQSLMDDAQAKVDQAAQPVRSWELEVADLYELDCVRYDSMQLMLFDVILLLDPNRGTKYQVQIQQKLAYPHYPEKNKIYVSTVTTTVQSTLKRLVYEIFNPNSSFYQLLKAKGVL